MVQAQISVDEELYERAKEIARRRGVTVDELFRRGLAAVVAAEPSDHPWMAFAGIFEGAAGDSESVDEVVYGRERP